MTDCIRIYLSAYTYNPYYLLYYQQLVQQVLAGIVSIRPATVQLQQQYSTVLYCMYTPQSMIPRIIRFAPLLLLLTSTGLSYDRGNKDRIYKYEFIYVKDTMVRSGPWYPLRIQFRTSKRGLYFLDRMKTLYWITRTVRYTIQVRFCYTYKWIYLRTCSTSRCLCPILYSI